MTPAHTDSPLRTNLFRGDDGANAQANDDEAERRERRRQTLLSTSIASGADSTGGNLEDNETLKKCLEIYNGNKLSKENAWSMSLIDTLSTLLDRHHKSLNNFKVAGSSLEASSKVYGLRVDSIHNDVLRMSAGLNAQKFAGRNLEEDNDDDDNANNAGDTAAAHDDNNAGEVAQGSAAEAAAKTSKPKPKRQRKPKATITKNKETLNAQLDTVPLQDPVFGKLNTIVGSINSSNRLMNNILPTLNSELRLRTNFSFWDKSEFPTATPQQDKENAETIDFFAALPAEYTAEQNVLPCDRLFRVQHMENLQLRPLHTGYIISDTPEAIDDKDNTRRFSLDSVPGGNDFDFGADGGLDLRPSEGVNVFHNSKELAMAFDLNAECEPMPELDAHAPMLDVDFGDYDEITTEERTAINNCRGLRKQAVVIEDLRPVDASTNLEYSYRPIDKISQFWAGPSHWKFKRVRSRPTAFGTQQQEGSAAVRNARQRRGGKSSNGLQSGKRGKQINFGEVHDNLFIKLDEKYKARKVNIQKKWDQRKLKLPSDMCIDANMFFKYKLAPGIPKPLPNCNDNALVDDSQSVTTAGEDMLLQTEPVGGDPHFGDDDYGDDLFLRASIGNENNMNLSSMSAQVLEGPDGDNLSQPLTQEEHVGNDTILEIGNDFEGAPSQVTKIIVPFAKRAKVIDMKQLKRSCTQLLKNQMISPINKEGIPKHPVQKDESYSEGVASFKLIYENLPDLLNKVQAESLSTSVAVYAMLHLSNDYCLRLIPQEDLEDFKIRQVRKSDEQRRSTVQLEQ